MGLGNPALADAAMSRADLPDELHENSRRNQRIYDLPMTRTREIASTPITRRHVWSLGRRSRANP